MRQKVISFFGMMCLTACSIAYMDWPSASEKDFWRKPGYTKSNVTKFLWEVCGYKRRGELVKDAPNLDSNSLKMVWEENVQHAEECMLQNGFIYEDKPEGFIESKNGGRCRWPDLQGRPSCKSLRNKD